MSAKTNTALSEEQVRANGPLSVYTRRLVHLLDVSGNACHILRVLLDHADQQTWGDCFPGKGALAAEARCSLSTVKKCLAELSRAGIIAVTQRPKNGLRWDSNEYAIQPAAFARASQNAKPPRAPRALLPGAPRDLPKASHNLPLGRDATPNVAKGMEPFIEPVIMQPPRAREGQIDLRPSMNETTTTTPLGGSDLLAPSRSQTNTAPSEKRAYQRDPSKMKTARCSHPGCKRTWKVWPPNYKPDLLCPDLHLPLQKQEASTNARIAHARAS